MIKSGQMAMAAMVLAVLVSGCGPGATTKTEKGAGAATASATPGAAPSRAPFEGCRWEYMTGAGLGVWSQVCPTYRLVAEEALKTLFVEDVRDGQVTRSEAMRVLTLPAGGLPALAEQLAREGGASAPASCALEPVTNLGAQPEGVARYSLGPTGALKDAWDRAVKSDVAPDTPPCGRYGVAIVGDRYIEVQAAHPDKAVFVELGSEIQIYEPSTLMIAAPAHSAGGHGDAKKSSDAH